METIDKTRQRIEARKFIEELFADSDEIMQQALVDFARRQDRYQELKAKAEKQPKVPFERLAETIIDYGEYRGRRFWEIPADRLDWYLAKAEENVKTLSAYLSHPKFERGD